ncbi:hypothetical protein RHMOL_Rhmol04G0321800 [Rhododendron molle]|uniref:Uncharacterized protein n=1 Tax=Rhododendron molle TaxID=49168 RepID=A0ACC0P7P1_RHOML|nr:hypothetical protein RHMOL_Rhmol04G0321800 [Rhododendron molle]
MSIMTIMMVPSGTRHQSSLVMPEMYAEAVEASDSTSDTEFESLGMSINNDQQETETEEEVENWFCSEVVPTEVNFSKNGSSKPAQEAISLGTSSKTFAQVPQTQDKW